MVFAAEDAGPTVERAGEAQSSSARRPSLTAVAAGLALGLPAGAVTALMLQPELPAAHVARDRLPRALAHVIGSLGNRLSLQGRPASPLRFEVSSRVDALPGGGAALQIVGEVFNPTGMSAPVPALELRLVDASGQTLERRMVRAPAAAVPAGGRIAFATTALDLPAGTMAARLAPRGAILDPS